MLLAERTRAERLAQIIKEMQRHRFGRRAESCDLSAFIQTSALRLRRLRGSSENEKRCQYSRTTN
jgi:hypothetical protein